MKKTLLALIALLIIVFAFGSIFGSGGEYAAERLFYHAMKMSSKIMANPDVVPPAMIASSERGFKKILDKYPNTNVARGAKLTLAEFYVFNKKYDKALTLLDSILASKEIGREGVSTAQFLKSVVYEKKNDEERTIEELKKLRDDYTDTQLGIQAPIYIAKYYRQKGKVLESEQSYEEALKFYGNIDAANKGKVIGYAAASLIIQIYLEQEDFEKAGDAVEKIIGDYPFVIALNQHLPYVEYIFIEKLKRPERVIAIYNNIFEKTNDQKLKAFLQKKLAEINKKNR